MIDQEEFNQNLKKYDELEKRGSYYPMFLDMIEKGLEIEAFLFILSTWNYATFKFVMNNFDLNNFKKIIRELKPYFDKFKGKTIENIKFNDYKNDIIHIFDSLSKIKGIKYTGASKLMHLKIPEVFIMWDNSIRNALGFKEGNSEDYYNFLLKMQEESKGITKNKNRTVAKCIDEYNFVKYTIPVLKERKIKREQNNKS